MHRHALRRLWRQGLGEKGVETVLGGQGGAGLGRTGVLRSSGQPRWSTSGHGFSQTPLGGAPARTAIWAFSAAFAGVDASAEAPPLTLGLVAPPPHDSHHVLKQRSWWASAKIIVHVWAQFLYVLLRGLLRLLFLIGVWAPVLFASPIALQLNLGRPLWLRAVREAIQLSGPAFIKIGQWAATRHDSFPADFCRELEHLHAGAPCHSFPHTRDAIERMFGRRLEDLFERFSEEPLASGSIGQIHTAWLSARGAGLVGLPRGTRVAVKVKHPAVDEIMERDFLLIRAVARAVDAIPGVAFLRMSSLLDQFGAPLRDQLDFRREAEHLERFGENFASFPYVIFPRALRPLVSRDVLVETFQEGHLISRHLDPARSQRLHENPLLARIGHQALLKMMIMDNFIHSDLHPGNILVRLEAPSTPWGKAVAQLYQSLVSWELRTDDPRARAALSQAATWVLRSLGPDLIDSRYALSSLIARGVGEDDTGPAPTPAVTATADTTNAPSAAATATAPTDDERIRSSQAASTASTAPAARPAAAHPPLPGAKRRRRLWRWGAQIPDTFSEGVDLQEFLHQLAHPPEGPDRAALPQLLSPRIVLLDPGMAQALEGEDRERMRDMFRGLLEMDGRRVGMACLAFSEGSPGRGLIRSEDARGQAFLDEIEGIFEKLQRGYDLEAREAAEARREQRRSRRVAVLNKFVTGRGEKAAGGLGRAVEPPHDHPQASESEAAGEVFSSGAAALQSTLEVVRRHGVGLPGHICSVVVTALVLEGWACKLDASLSVLDSLERLFESFDYGVGWPERVGRAVDRSLPQSALNMF